jgi:hypothetical protein
MASADVPWMSVVCIKLTSPHSSGREGKGSLSSIVECFALAWDAANKAHARGYMAHDKMLASIKNADRGLKKSI